MSEKKRIFISYSHKDRRWLEELLTHLAPLRDTFEVWADSQIDAGQDWEEQINSAIEKADVVILLVTADFLASKFMQEVELPRILEASRSRGTLVLPILVQHSLWNHTPLREFQFLNPPDKPLASLSREARHAAYVQIARRLDSALTLKAPETPGPVASADFSEEIARKVFALIKADLAAPASKASKKTQATLRDASSLVFVICSFSPDMEPVFEGMKAAAKKFGLEAKRVKDVIGDYQITSQIMSMIADARLIVADLTDERPNVYFELGYARGLGKTVVTCARQGTEIHFDVKDWTYIPYNDSRVLEKALGDRFRFEIEKGA